MVEESAVHALFECASIASLWAESGFQTLIKWEDTSTLLSFIMGWKRYDLKIQQRASLMAWTIWSERNRRVFDKQTTLRSVLAIRVQRLAEEHDK